jgi:hypothetical protein
VFGNTPKSFLHNAFAGHEDYIVVCHHSTTCVHQQSVDCDIDNLVVNANYLSAGTVPSTLISRFFIQPIPAIYLSVYEPSWFSFRDYTGPPFSA